MGASGGDDASLDGASQGGGGIRKEQMGLRNFRKVNLGLQNFRKVISQAKFSQGTFASQIFAHEFHMPCDFIFFQSVQKIHRGAN